MKQVEKYLLKVALLLGIFIMPFAASAEEIDMKEKVAKFLNDTGFAGIYQRPTVHSAGTFIHIRSET